MRSSTIPLEIGSSALHGSSRRITCGSSARARAMQGRGLPTTRTGDARVRVGTRAPSRLFKSGAWIDATRAAATGAVAPGASARVTFAILAPEVTAATHLDERFELVRDG